MTPVLYLFLILPLSLLPMPILYWISDGLYLLVFHIFGYRKKVVFENLRRSFPMKTEGERNAIARDFYHHFCDLIVESLKAFMISKQELKRRFKVENPEILNEAFAKSQSLIFVGGHYNNWELLALGLRDQIRHRVVGIYKPLSNRYLDRKLLDSRCRYGLEVVAMKEVSAYLSTEVKLVHEKRALPFVMVFAVDQSPGDPRKAHWARFLNQDSGIPFGAEKFARQYDLPVFFIVIHKVSRGHYTLELRPLSEAPHPDPKGWILEQATALLEAEIQKDPRFWLWTHRRWKHKKPAA